MTDGPRVRVLLSVHRGPAFIAEQVQSLARQRDVTVRLGYHLDSEDDGSESCILSAIPDAERRGRPSGLGLPAAYLELVADFDDDSDLFAFCDQDDVWDEGKLAAAAGALMRSDPAPTLWICGVAPFSSSVRDGTAPSIPRVGAEPSFGNALVETIGPGCAMVWNRSLQRLLVDCRPGRGVLMHDSWVYLVASALGGVIIEGRSLVRYRIHSSNAVGLSRGLTARLKRVLSVPTREMPTMASQAAEFDRVFGSRMSAEDRRLVKALAGWDRRALARAWARGVIRRTTIADQLLLLPRLLLPRRFSGAPGTAPAPECADP